MVLDVQSLLLNADVPPRKQESKVPESALSPDQERSIDENRIVTRDLATAPLESKYIFPAAGRKDEELGRGEFGLVRMCVDKKSGKMFACKTVAKRKLYERNRTQDILMELYGMHIILPHANIVHLNSVHEDRDSVHLVMDMCAGGDLFDLVSKSRGLPEREAAWVFRQVARGLLHCHNWGIAHLDIKPENILVQINPSTKKSGAEASGADPRVTVKVSDFGQAVILKPGEKAVGLAGSINYMAPEVVAMESYDFSADVWSCGILLYAMLSGTLPFYGQSPEEVFQLIRHKQPRFSSRAWQSTSHSAVSLVQAMLSKDPMQRPSMKEVLCHPWLRKMEKTFQKPVVGGEGWVSPDETILSLIVQK